MPTNESDDARVYRFGPFELNARTRALSRLGRPVAIQPKPFDLLLYLIRHRDRFVSREELLTTVWQGVHVDGEAIRFTVHAARKAVDDDGDRQEVIRTVPRAGFQLVAQVEEVATPRERTSPALQATASGASRSAFLGRDRPMAEIEALLEAAARGESRVLLLSGEAGIGKTRVLEQLADLAGMRGFRVLQGRCVESDGAPAFWPWVQVLRAAVGSDPSCVPPRSLGGVAPEVAWMVPELRPLAAESQPLAPGDARAARFLMFDSVTTFLKDLATDVPHVLSIDDLHRADAASAALFHHVARELGHAGGPRLILVGTYREAELRATPAVADPIISATTLPHSRLEPLRGLEPSEVGSLVHTLSGRVPSIAVVADLHQKTNGNPFFLNQIVRVLENEHRLPQLETSESLALELPRHVQDAIRHQLRLVPDRVQALLELASVIGVDLTVTELELTSDLDRPAILSALGLAAQAAVVAERTGEPDGYRFVHALVRDAIYAGLLPDARARHHARIARALETRIPDHPGPECASLAHHYAHSSTRELIARSVHFYELAATWSSSRAAFEDALSCLERALALLDDTEPLADRRRCRLLLQLGDALTNVGARDRAREVLQTAAEIARRTGLHDEAATAALRFAPDLLAIETGVFDDDLVRILEAAIDSLEEGASPLRAKLLARLAIAHQWDREQPSRSGLLCDEALRIASEVGDRGTTEYVGTAASLINFSLIHPERQTEVLSRHDVPLEILQRVLRVTSLLLLGDVVEADAEIVRFADLVRRSRHPQARWYVDMMRAMRAQMEGRYEQAAQLATRFLTLGTKFGDRNAIHSYGVQTLMSSFDTGGVEAHEPLVRDLVASFPNVVGWRSGLVLLLTELGRLEEARREFSSVVTGGDLEQARPNEWCAAYGALALACGELGDRTVAERLYGTLGQLQAAELIVVGYGSYCVGSAQRLLGVLASVMQEWDLARTHFDKALSKNAAIAALACNGRVHFEYARMLHASGNLTAAARQAAQAREIALGLGMTRLAARVESFIRGDR